MLVKLQKYRVSSPANPRLELFSGSSSSSIIQTIDQIAFPSSVGNLTAGALQKLLSTGQASNVREAILLLSSDHKKQLFSKLSSNDLERLISYSQESQPRWLRERLFAFGMEQLKEGKQENAAVVLNFTNSPETAESLRKKSQSGLNLIHGYGAWGDQAEHFTTRFFPNSLGPQLVLPMTIAALFGRKVGVYALEKIALQQGFAKWLPAFFTGPVSGRFLAGGISLAAESPAFIAANLGIRKWSGESLPTHFHQLVKESISFTSNLGVLKMMNYGGNQLFLSIHQFNRLGIPTKLTQWQRVTQAAIPQASMFVGMAATHKLEQIVQFRPEVSTLTTLLGTANSLVALGLGGKAGSWLAGRGVAKLQVSWGIKTGFYLRMLEIAPIHKFDATMMGSSSTPTISKPKKLIWAKLSPATLFALGVAAFASSGASGNGDPTLGLLMLLGLPLLGTAIKNGSVRNRADIKDFQPIFLSELREHSDPAVLIEKLEGAFGHSILSQKLRSTIELTLASEKSEIFKDQALLVLAQKFPEENYRSLIEGITSSKVSLYERFRAIKFLALNIHSNPNLRSSLDWYVMIYGLISCHMEGVRFDSGVVNLALQAYSQADSKADFNFEPFVYALRQTAGPVFVKAYWIKELAREAYSSELAQQATFNFQPFIRGILFTEAEPIYKVYSIHNLASEIYSLSQDRKSINLKPFIDGIRGAEADGSETNQAMRAILQQYYPDSTHSK